MTKALNRQIYAKMAETLDISKNLSFIREKIVAACSSRTPELQELCEQPRLVAVSKKKSIDHIVKAYEAGVEHFGENYVQEIVDKAKMPEVSQCPQLKFHFIGHLQTNKISKLLEVGDKLFVIETIDSQKLAKNVNDALMKRNVVNPLNVMVQINTSGEDSKSGADPNSCIDLAKFIINECQKLKLMGLMTIGSIEQSVNADENADFKVLSSLRTKLCNELGLERKNVELSMGMSADFENAIIEGSTNVRVGSSIFGVRDVQPRAT